MKIFVDDSDLLLDESSPSYHDDVLAAGARLDKRVQEFLGRHRKSARRSNSVRKCLRKLHQAGKLNAEIDRFQQLVAAEKVVDPTPVHMRQPLKVM